MYRAILRIPVNACIFLVRIYQYTFSMLLGPRCRFYPSCSEYTIQALKKRGFVVGSILSFKRIIKCHPGHPGGVDEVPQKTKVAKKK